MAIYDNNGTTNAEIGKLYDNDGTTDYQIGKVYDNNGTTDSLIYQSYVQTTYTNAPVYKNDCGIAPDGITWQSNANWETLGFYDVSEVNSITFKNTVTTSSTSYVHCAFYTKEEVSASAFISIVTYNKGSTANQTITVPAGAKYMLVNRRKDGTCTVTI